MRRVILTMDDDDFLKLNAEKEKTGLSWERFVLGRCLRRNRNRDELPRSLDSKNRKSD